MIQKIKKEEFKNTFLEKLLQMPDSPESLNFEGQIFEKDKYKLLTVVGSRRHSLYAKKALEKIIGELEGSKLAIVSGLALGIDSLAHLLALKHNLKTLAFPGSGLEKKVLYPRSNVTLAEKIIQAGGVLLSEFPNDFKATPWSFPKRNRLMAALSDLVLVVEASEKSGTLITARLALEYNNGVATIPNGIFSEQSIGSNSLLKSGAYPVFSGGDILELLGLDSEAKQEVFDFNDLEKEEKVILKKLTEPMESDSLFQKSGLDSSEFAIALSALEIKGLVKIQLGKVFKNF